MAAIVASALKWLDMAGMLATMPPPEGMAQAGTTPMLAGLMEQEWRAATGRLTTQAATQSGAVAAVAVAHPTKTPEAAALPTREAVAEERVAPSIVTILYSMRRLAGPAACMLHPLRVAAGPQGQARQEPLARPLSDERRPVEEAAAATPLELAMLVAQAVRPEEAEAVAVEALRQAAWVD